jgi:DNA-binding CsgD family transcriptional regulator
MVERKNMKLTEALKYFNNSRRKMAESFGISVQSVQYWSKLDKIPELRELQIKNMIREGKLNEKIGD